MDKDIVKCDITLLDQTCKNKQTHTITMTGNLTSEDEEKFREFGEVMAETTEKQTGCKVLYVKVYNDNTKEIYSELNFD